MPILSDDRLARLIRLRLPGITGLLARRAAARQLHAPALYGAPHDPVVVALLGLFADLSLDQPMRGQKAGRAQAVAAAALGMREPPADAHGWPRPWRRRLAAALAPADPECAAALLFDDPLGQAACLLASDRSADATIGRAEAPATEASLLRAAFAMRRRDAVTARAAINSCFDLAELRPPLTSPDVRLDAYRPRDVAQVEGPLVSVIVPMHDDAATIATTIGSLQAQSWRALEIIVCDDRSRDQGMRIVAALAEQDHRIRLIASTAAPGASGTRNCAIAAARGDLIAFLDADDWAHPQRIARQVARLGAGAATVSAHYRVDGTGAPMAPRVFPLLRLCPISMLVRRPVLAAAGGFELSRAGADAELLGRLDTLFGRAAVPRDRAPLTVARWRANSISSDATRGLHDRERLEYRSRWMHAHAARFAAEALPWVVPGERG